MKSQRFEHLIFDLDGTLIDSAKEILRCLKEAYRLCQISESEFRGHPLNEFVIGPPLDEMIARVTPQLDLSIRSRIAETYIEIYDSSSFQETVVYPGVLETLAELNREGVSLYLATNKRIAPTRRIIERKALGPFKGVMGSDLIPGLKLTKTKMIRDLIDRWDLNREETLMVGDSPDDIRAAHQNSIRAVAVMQGYSPREALEEVQPDFFVEKVQQILVL